MNIHKIGVVTSVLIVCLIMISGSCRRSQQTQSSSGESVLASEQKTPSKEAAVQPNSWEALQATAQSCCELPIAAFTKCVIDRSHYRSVFVKNVGIFAPCYQSPSEGRDYLCLTVRGMSTLQKKLETN